MRTHESTRKLARRVESGTARIRSAPLSHQRGRWHVALSVELPDPEQPVRDGGRVVGVDLGITSLAVLSTGQVVPNPRHLDSVLAALRRTQRQASRRRGPDRRTRTVPSNRWRKTAARISAVHTRVANARRDGLHKLTTRLVASHDVVVIEDLNVAGMVANHRLARAISGLGMAEFRRQLGYKTREAGVRLNLAALAAQASEPSCGRTENEPAGNPRKTAPGGNGYRHGKAPPRSQGRLREVAAP